MKNVSISIFRTSGEPRLEFYVNGSDHFNSLRIGDAFDFHNGNDVVISFPIEFTAKVKKAVAAFEREMNNENE